jgi:MFS family permease
MTDTSLPADRFTPGEFRLGHVFSQAWTVFSRNFFTFTLVTLIAGLPALLMPTIPQPAPGSAPTIPDNIGTIAALSLIVIVLKTLSQAVVLYGAFQVMRGRRVDLAESARIGLRRFFPLIVVAIVVPLVAGFAAILLIFPMIMLYMMWLVATPVCVVEQLGPFASTARSRQLTKGHRWKLFGMILLLLIPALIIGAIIGVVAVAVTGGFLTFMTTTTVGQIVNLVWGAIWSAFLAILIVVTYHDLRVAKEGVDTDQIAAVFE